MTAKFKLIIFDWDGTLMDSTALITHCVQQAFNDLKLPVPSKAKAQNIIGLGLKEAILMLYPQADETQIQAIAAAYRVHFFASRQDHNHLFSGAITLLDTLKSRGYHMAVATGKSRQGLDKVLQDTGLNAYFRTTRAADETASKPDPLMLAEILQQLNVGVAEAIMVGDTEYDLEMASNIGMASIGVSYGAHHKDRLQLHQPIACIDQLETLLDYV